VNENGSLARSYCGRRVFCLFGVVSGWIPPDLRRFVEIERAGVEFGHGSAFAHYVGAMAQSESNYGSSRSTRGLSRLSQANPVDVQQWRPIVADFAKGIFAPIIAVFALQFLGAHFDDGRYMEIVFFVNHLI
jgi:hypothetical protein